MIYRYLSLILFITLTPVWAIEPLFVVPRVAKEDVSARKTSSKKVSSSKQVSSKKEKVASSKDASSKKRSPASSKFFKEMMKSDVFGEDYMEDLDVSKVVDQVHRLLSSLDRICNVSGLRKKVKYFNYVITRLRDLSNELLVEVRLGSSDRLFFLTLQDLVDVKNINYNKPITVNNIRSADLRTGFKVYYFSQNNLSLEASVDDFPDLIAQKIYTGIECLY